MICTKCKEDKELTEFYKYKSGTPMKVCKLCKKKSKLDRKEYFKEYAKNYRKTHKTKRVRKVTTIVDLRKFKPKKKKTRLENLLTGDQCMNCFIKVGKGFIEEKFYYIGEQRLCGQCYNERNDKKNKAKSTRTNI